MPSWGDILKEFAQSREERGPDGPDCDGIRDKYIARLREHTNRAVIVYASRWLHGTARSMRMGVEGDDVHGLMEVCYQVSERQLDLVLHSPGGSIEAAEQMLNYLRTEFDYIRAFIPLQAKSAATMIALGCDEIVLGDHSELGPIDPQILVPAGDVERFAPAIAILRDFYRAQDECADDVNRLLAWSPILRSYACGLIEFCWQQVELSLDVVTGWLEKYMLAHEDMNIEEGERHRKARGIAEYFGSEESYDTFRAHGRPIRIEDLRGQGLRVRALEDDSELQDIVLSIYHATDITWNNTTAVKLIENHLGRRKVRIESPIQLQGQLIPVQPGNISPSQ